MEFDNLKWYEKIGYVGGAIPGCIIGVTAAGVAYSIKKWGQNGSDKEADEQASKVFDTVVDASGNIGKQALPLIATVLVERLAGQIFDKNSGGNCNNPCEKKIS